MNRRQHLALTAGLWLPPLAASLSACGTKDMAPDLPYTLLNGQGSRIGAHQGRVLLVNFWATSCSTCVREMPHIVSTYRKYQAKGYDTLAVAMSYDPAEYVTNFVQTRQLPFAVTLDRDASLAKGFGDIRLTPTSILIDKRGQIVKRYVGEPDFTALHTRIEALIAA
jgi:peroxiredoxin